MSIILLQRQLLQLRELISPSIPDETARLMKSFYYLGLKVKVPFQVIYGSANVKTYSKEKN